MLNSASSLIYDAAHLQIVEIRFRLCTANRGNTISLFAYDSKMPMTHSVAA